MVTTHIHAVFGTSRVTLSRAIAAARPVIFGTAIAILAAHPTPLIAQPTSPVPALAVVDFAKEHKQASMAGFLNSYAKPADWPMERAKAMAPGLWRGRAEMADYAAQLGTKFTMATSFELNQQLAAPDGTRKVQMPYGTDLAHPDWTAYEQWLTQLVQKYRGRVAYWEFWNEPDLANFWPRPGGLGSKCEEPFVPPAGLYESYAHFYKVVRREAGPDVQITAPSLANYCLPFLRSFVRYAADHNLEVNALGWHEFRDPKDDRSSLEGHLKEARAEFFYDPKRPATARYKNLKLKEIQINELIGPEDQFHPGDTATYLYYLEKGGADTAARACWPDMAAPGLRPGGCNNNSIDSVLVPDMTPGQPLHQPRGTWWVYKQYADMQPHRFICAQQWKNAVCLAGVNSAGEPRLLIGQHGYGNTSVGGLKVRLDGLSQLPALAGATKLHVSVTQALTGPQAQPDLGPATQFDAAVVDGRATLNLPRLGGHSALLVNVSRAAN